MHIHLIHIFNTFNSHISFICTNYVKIRGNDHNSVMRSNVNHDSTVASPQVRGTQEESHDSYAIRVAGVAITQ